MDLLASFRKAGYFLRELDYSLSGLLLLWHSLAGLNDKNSFNL
jgi:hypothetical protein